MMKASSRRLNSDASRIKLREARVDQWFNRLGQGSQVLLLLLGVFGYFYTVLPVYQKSLLDEEIAKKTIELSRMEAKASELGGKIAEKETELAAKDRRLAEAGRALQALSTRYNSAVHDARIAEGEAMRARVNEVQAQADAVTRYSQLRAQLYGEALSTLQICPLVTQFGTKDFELGLKEKSLDECLDRLRTNSQQWLKQLSAKDVEGFTSAAAWAAQFFRAEHVAIVEVGNVQMAEILANQKSGVEREYNAALAAIRVNSEVTGKYVALIKKVRSAIAKRALEEPVD